MGTRVAAQCHRDTVSLNNTVLYGNTCVSVLQNASLTSFFRLHCLSMQVVWGHEHECRIEPGESIVGTFRISQPGSSVATSLISGEAVRKHVGLLDIKNNRFRLKPIPLTQVRSFAMSEISLRELKDHLDPEDPKIDAQVTKVLEDEVKMVIREARQKTKDLLKDAKVMGNITDDGRLKYKLENRDAVLVRVKVDHSGFTTLNNQRFGAKFVGHVVSFWIVMSCWFHGSLTQSRMSYLL